jgi:hypothetical protein
VLNRILAAAAPRRAATLAGAERELSIAVEAILDEVADEMGFVLR